MTKPNNGGPTFESVLAGMGNGPKGMTLREDNGGPAFPQLLDVPSRDIHGMTLRDYFAAQALAGSGPGTFGWTQRFAAQIAYEQADAMLAEREKEGGK